MVEVERRYIPALDGLRGLAVALVLLFHGEVAFARGGHVGVTAFFVLSGFLITALLLQERDATGRVDLRHFWGRRAKRLVPAALLTLPLIAFVVAAADLPPSDGVVGDAVAAALWVANWHFVVDHQSYADLFSLPSPFQHFWSLAVEEQFYLLFPLLLLATGGRRRRLGAAALGLLAVSVVQSVRLSADGFTPRAWYGTDTRMSELLVGVLLAVVLVQPEGVRRFSGRARQAVSAAGGAGLLGLLAATVLLDQGNPWLFRGGLLAVAVGTAAVVAAATQPGWVATVLSAPPLTTLGVISYGAYLFHWPVFLLLTERSTGAPAPMLFALRVLTTLALALISFSLVEHPIRYGRVPWRVGLSGWVLTATAGVAAVAVGAGQLSLPLPSSPATAPATAAVVPQQQPVPARAAQPGTTQEQVRARSQSPVTRQAPVAPPPTTTARHARREAIPAAFAADPAKQELPPVPHVPPGALKVAVVGDSVGKNLGEGLAVWASERHDVVTYNLSVPACPLSRGKDRRAGTMTFDVRGACGWWDDPSNKRRQALEQYDPDVIVVQDGINEIFDRRQSQWGGWRDPKDPEYQQWLTGEYGTIAQRWGDAGAKLLVLNAPCGDFDRYELFRAMGDSPQRVQALDAAVYPRVLGVSQADLFQRLCPGGRYSDTVEGVPDGRPDGLHLSKEASAALARNWLGPLVLQTASGGVGPVGIR